MPPFPVRRSTPVGPVLLAAVASLVIGSASAASAAPAGSAPSPGWSDAAEAATAAPSGAAPAADPASTDRRSPAGAGPGSVLASLLASAFASAVETVAESVVVSIAEAAPQVAPPVVQETVTTFAVIGDSLTAGGEAISGTEVRGSASWVPAADAVPGLHFAGGWAVPGSTTEEMLAATVPADAEALVILAGTNDVLRGVPWERSAVALDGMVASAGIPVVAVVAIPPNDKFPELRQSYNAALAALAAARGWTYVDPWAPIDAGGTFLPGTTTDGTHLPDGVAAESGRRIGEAVAALG
ncbi:SGNH/GDSL hydrolase family protein [Blastococcus atacamensis]|uniref:SGNH/GDSL hydrolase family protein n=1 Tax=Blastococcus atacamensis TaxID=2070508 RepID=UPI000CEBF110|nr:SGNH/GDSL hydrolase family protein [Blastococcus atacamensis]